MMYGEEIHSIHGATFPATAMTAIALEAAAAAILTIPCPIPGSVLYWGYIPTVAFNYDTKVTKGILSLYRYTKQIQTAVLGNAAGAGYAVGDLLSVTQAGASGGIVRVTGVNAGAVTTVEVVKKGIHYVAGSNLATVALTGSGNNAFTVTISDKKLLDQMGLEDPADDAKYGKLGFQYMRRVPNIPGDVSPTPEPPAAFRAGEQVVVEITTQAAGGTEVGDFQPIVAIQHRGENFANQDLWVEMPAV